MKISKAMLVKIKDVSILSGNLFVGFTFNSPINIGIAIFIMIAVLYREAKKYGMSPKGW